MCQQQEASMSHSKKYVQTKTGNTVVDADGITRQDHVPGSASGLMQLGTSYHVFV